MYLVFMRNCKKCKVLIPWQMRIHGKIHHLKNRIFCVKCSPFNGRNTRSDDPSLPSKRQGPYSTWSEDRKNYHKALVYKHGIERKIKLIKILGGCCKKCGYKEDIRALSFHHRDPKNKKFGLGINNLWSKSWKECLSESKKCDILCLNCHATINKSPIFQALHERYGIEIKL